MLSDSPRFNAAHRYAGPLRLAGISFMIAGGLLVWLPMALAGMSRFPGYVGAALLAAGGALVSAAIMGRSRLKLLAAERENGRDASDSAADGAASGKSAAAVRRSGRWRLDPDAAARWPPPVVGLLCALLSCSAIIALWRVPPVAGAAALSRSVAGALLLLAFPLLVLERRYNATSAELLPEAPQLARVLRMPLAACVVLGMAQFLLAAGFGWIAVAGDVVGMLIFASSVEMIVRCAAMLFMPFAPMEMRKSAADSRIAGALARTRLPDIKAMRTALRRQFGVDLSRSWALAFIRAAAWPMAAGMAVLAWALTSITTLGIDQRGIYERLGKPVAVFGPGLHLHLPWPFGRIRPVEIGVAHLLPIEFLLPGGDSAEQSVSVGHDEPEKLPATEDPAPESADRLWTEGHPFEGSYLIASQEDGKQSFQLVDVDMAVIYRAGASDEAARQVAFRVDGLDNLIQALSGQLLVSYFSGNTLLDLLGRSRETFTRQFRSNLQAELDRLSAGVEIVGVSVEAIHPPPGAASAYHDVQAAGIRAGSSVAERRGEASLSLGRAQQAALEDRNAAVAAAATRIGQARAQEVTFAADEESYRRGGASFLFERWLENLETSLGHGNFVLLDYRLTGSGMPTLDLRDTAGGTALTPEESAAEEGEGAGQTQGQGQGQGQGEEEGDGE